MRATAIPDYLAIIREARLHVGILAPSFPAMIMMICVSFKDRFSFFFQVYLAPAGYLSKKLCTWGNGLSSNIWFNVLLINVSTNQTFQAFENKKATSCQLQTL